MYGELYLIFNETYDNLTMVSASLYTNTSSLEKELEDFHRVYVFLNYKYLLSVIEKKFSSFINDIENKKKCRNFTLKFVIGCQHSNIENYVKGVMDKINKHPDNLVDRLSYADESIRDDVFELYLNAARKLILDIELLNK